MARTAGVTTTENMFREIEESETGVVLDPSSKLDSISEPGGHATLYDVRTGEPSRVRLYEGDKTLRAYLDKRDENGNVVFSMKPPAIERAVPSVPCWMNKASDKFSVFQSTNQVVGNGCSKMLFTDADARSHMENAHPDQLAHYLNEEAGEFRARDAAREDRLTELLALALQNKDK